MTDELWEGAQGLFDQIQDGHDCECDVQAQSIAETNVEGEDDGTEDGGEEVERRNVDN